MTLANHIDYSILVCTYNPDERLLNRCLNAIYQLDRSGLECEIIVVDNNSPTPLNTVPYVQEYLRKIDGIRIIEVKEQGLTPARIAGIEAARGKSIIFFDDDNEPASDYLQKLKELQEQYSYIAAWGPGNIWVDFIDGIDAEIEQQARAFFQERHEAYIAYANTRNWQSCYPYGTGMCVNAAYLKAYKKLVEDGQFTLSDRKGNDLSSGGDVQIVLYCLSLGHPAGTAPELKMNHVIPAKRTNDHYLKRLLYGAAYAGGSICTLEVFPEYRTVLEAKILRPAKFSRRALKVYFKLWLKPNRNKTFDFATYMGSNCGIYSALNRDIPSKVEWVKKKLKLD